MMPRPVYMSIVTDESVLNKFSYNLDSNHCYLSVIINKKGGRTSMTKTIVKALEGFEKIFDELNEMKANIEAEKQMAYEQAMIRIDEEFASKLERIEKALEAATEIEEIEVEDEEIPVEETTEEVTEETVNC